MTLDTNTELAARSEANAIYSAFFMEGLRDNDYEATLSVAESLGMGAIELVAGLVPYSLFADRLIVSSLKASEGLTPSGVFPYEVCSVFGKWYGEHVLSKRSLPGETTCKDWLKAKTLEFFRSTTDRKVLEKIEAAIEEIWPFGGAARAQA